MPTGDSRVTIHMVASLDGFIARKDGRVDWLETSDEFAGGETMAPEVVEAFLETIDCYVMGSRTWSMVACGQCSVPSGSSGVVPWRASAFVAGWPTKCAIRSCRF